MDSAGALRIRFCVSAGKLHITVTIKRNGGDSVPEKSGSRPLTSIVSYPERGEGGNNRYRGNCSPKLVEDPMNLQQSIVDLTMEEALALFQVWKRSAKF